jgi:DNA-binding IclR family transcriptional regulator
LRYNLQLGGNILQAIDRISLILEYLATHPSGATLSDIAEQIGLAQSVVHRFLHALKKHSYVRQDSMTKKYILSIKLFSLGAQVIKNNDIRRIARPHMECLCKKTKSFVFLCLFEQNIVVCIDTVQTDANVSFFVKIGSAMPINSSAAAQSIIAFLTPKEMERIVNAEQLLPFTQKTLVEKEALLKRLETIRSEGFATCDEELEPGVIGISAPIRNYDDAIVGSITILKSKITEAVSQNFAEELKQTARLISADLGNSTKN